MKSHSPVSKMQLSSAAVEVQRELFQAGFWNEGSRLPKTDIVWCRFPQITVPDALGFFVYQTHPLHSLLGLKVGHIYVPQYVLVHGFWQERGSLRGILRHEYGHALAHHYPSLINGKWFQGIFGGKYSDEAFPDDWEGDFVSDYAGTNPSEDFAETFMVYLRNRGGLPRCFSTPAMGRKWKFIRDLGRVISSGSCKW
jgi:hypothetical protein